MKSRKRRDGEKSLKMVYIILRSGAAGRLSASRAFCTHASRDAALIKEATPGSKLFIS